MKYQARILFSSLSPSADNFIGRDTEDLNRWLGGTMGVDWEVDYDPGRKSKHLRLNFKRKEDQQRFIKEWYKKGNGFLS